MPIEIRRAGPLTEPKRERRSLGEIQIGRQGPTGKDRIFFTERLALLLETGNPLHASLESLEQMRIQRNDVVHLRFEWTA